MTESDRPFQPALFAGLALAVGVLTLVGWAIQSPLLLHAFPTYPPLDPFTAEVIVLAAVGLLLSPRAMVWAGITIALVCIGSLVASLAGYGALLGGLHPFDHALVAAERQGATPAWFPLGVLALIGLAMVLLGQPRTRQRAWIPGGMLAAAATAAAWTVLVSYTVGVMEIDASPRPARVAVLAMVGTLLMGLVLLQRGWRLTHGERRFHLVRWWLLAAWAVALAYILELLSAVVRRPDVIGVWPATLALLAVTGATLAAVIGLGMERNRSARRLLEARNAALREQERQLARSAAMLRAALDASLDAFYLLEACRDSAGHVQDFRFLDLNVRGADAISGSREELLGSLLCEQVPECRTDGLFGHYVMVLESGVPLEAEFRLAHGPGDGRVRYVRQQIVKVGDGIAVTSRDITSGRQLEEQFRHSQKMDAVGRVASGVAHDFNNLLTVVRGITDLLLEDPELSEAHRADLREVEGAVKRGAGLTSRLLAFSRRQPVEPKRLSIGDLVTDVMALTRRALPGNVAIEIDLAAHSPVVLADRLLLEQAMMNLILNARDAMDLGGILTVRTEQVQLDAPRPYDQAVIPVGLWARIAIIDTGTGMSPQVIEHLFEPFFTTKPAGKGTGLGLSTAFGIVRQAGGHLVIAETGPRGTTAHLYLPTIDANDPEIAVVTLEGVPRSGEECVLVVDDDAAVRGVVRRLLTRAGYQVTEVESAEAALAALASGPPFALLVTDMVMPGMGGGELARRACEADPRLRVLYISGFTDDASIRDLPLESGRAFLPKPFISEEFLRQVRELLDGSVTPT
ncbi:MAG: ATP-binding protein [Gemmatimonadota bacterium]